MKENIMTIRLQTVIGQNIKRLREESGLTQTDLAEEMLRRGFGWRKETVFQSESERRTVSIVEILGLCLIFGSPLDAILLPKGSETAKTSRKHEVQLTDTLALNGKEMLHLIQSGAVTPPTAKERELRRLFSETNAIQVRLSRTEVKALEAEKQRQKLQEELAERLKRINEIEGC